MEKTTFFTRKNLIAWSLSFFFAFIILFTGLCLEPSFEFANKENPIASLAAAFNFKTVSVGLKGFVPLLLIAIYVVVATGFVIYEKRYATLNRIKAYSGKMIFIYVGTVISCLVLSLGIGLVIQSPLTKENVLNSLTFTWQAFVIALMIYIILFVIVAAVLMFVINFIRVDKPYKFFGEQKEIEFEDEDLHEEHNIAGSFDGATANVTSNATVAGVSETLNITTTSKVEKIDDREKVFPSLSTIDANYNGFEIQSVPTDNYSLEEICVKFRNYLAKVEKLYFDLDTIRIFVSGFAASHFMILEGLSGTGKSSLPRYFSKFINGNYLFVPVQATWRDRTSILGYFNDFSKTYSETEFLIKLYEANYNPDQVNIFVLDEMNISRVEYYFADFLSILEYPQDEWKLKIMQLPYEFVPPVKLENGYLQIPANAFFVGTANKDDSTFSITDKVYDRAITIDFDDRNIPFAVNEDAEPIHLSNSKFQELLQEAVNNSDYQMKEEDYNKFSKVCSYIYDEFDITFGNRIMNQIESLVPAFIACGGKKEDALDFLLCRKILVKLEGRFEEYVKSGLKHLLALLEKTYGAHVFARSEKAIQNLIRKL